MLVILIQFPVYSSEDSYESHHEQDNYFINIAQG